MIRGEEFGGLLVDDLALGLLLIRGPDVLDARDQVFAVSEVDGP